MINSLKSFLYVGDNGVVRPVHPSFMEFLSSNSRCQNPKLYLDIPFYQKELAHCCLACMQSLSGISVTSMMLQASMMKL